MAWGARKKLFLAAAALAAAALTIAVAGDPPLHAVANVRFVAANQPDAKTLDVDFLREGAEWKACRYYNPRAV